MSWIFIQCRSSKKNLFSSRNQTYIRKFPSWYQLGLFPQLCDFFLHLRPAYKITSLLLPRVKQCWQEQLLQLSVQFIVWLCSPAVVLPCIREEFQLHMICMLCLLANICWSHVLNNYSLKWRCMNSLCSAKYLPLLSLKICLLFITV